MMMMHGAVTEEDCSIVQAHMMQMTFMVNPQFHQELSYLNKDERLLRWMMIRSRGNAWTKISKD
jgi:small subunit ribosomal protein S6